MLEVAKYAFWGGVAWGGLAVLGNVLQYLQLRIKTRKEILNHLEEMCNVLERTIEDCEKAKRTYEVLVEALSDIEDLEEARSTVEPKKLH